MTLEREVKDWKSDGMDGETESARVQDEVDQEASKHNEADGMKRSSDPEIGSACTDAREKERWEKCGWLIKNDNRWVAGRMGNGSELHASNRDHVM